MKLRLFAPVLTGLARALGIATLAALGTTPILNQPSLAEGATFFCGTSKGVPVTYARTPRGNVPMIRWVDNKSFASAWTPRRRCQEVSRRFQRNYDNGTLKTLKTARLKGQPVVCAASSQDAPCTDRTLLFTLKPESNAELTVARLMDSRGLAAGNIVNQSGCQDDCPIYLNVDVYLDNATVEENTSPSN